ncbi:hypothetical protein OAR31_01525 [Candidatus Marinimicrobia bacterium]|nr:hypothetical protein [Candidatus Neomarinimicrobiota bacterium]
MLFYKKVIQVSFLLLFIGCYTSFENNSNDETNALRYHLGTTTSGYFQKSVQEIITLYGYSIKEYDNYGNYQIADTYWKNRNPYQSESDAGFLESKTKLLFTASNDRLGSFQYDANLFTCYLDIINSCFDGEKWIKYNNVPELQVLSDSISKAIQDDFSIVQEQ